MTTKMPRVEGETLMAWEALVKHNLCASADAEAAFPQLVKIAVAAYYVARDATFRTGGYLVELDAMEALEGALGQGDEDD